MKWYWKKYCTWGEIVVRYFTSDCKGGKQKEKGFDKKQKRVF